MKKLIFLILFNFSLINNAASDELNCSEFKKYSSEFFNCKTKTIKNKAIAIGKDFVEDTKEYQKKKFEESKEQIGNTKKQIEEKTDKILKK